MKPKDRWRNILKWRIVLVRIAVNGLALLITTVLVPGIAFLDRTVGAVLLMALILGLLNAIVKPIVQFLTAPLLFASYGLVVVVINALILMSLSWLFPSIIAVHGLLWVLVGGMVIGLTASLLENLLGATPPIISDQPAQTRKQAPALANGRTHSLTDQAAATGGAETRSPETNPTTPPEASDETVHT